MWVIRLPYHISFRFLSFSDVLSGYRTGDLAESRRFYLKGLGWQESPAGNEHISFIQLNGIVLALWSFSTLAADCGLPDRKPEFSGITLAYNAHTRDEVDNVMGACRKCRRTNP